MSISPSRSISVEKNRTRGLKGKAFNNTALPGPPSAIGVFPPKKIPVAAAITGDNIDIPILIKIGGVNGKKAFKEIAFRLNDMRLPLLPRLLPPTDAAAIEIPPPRISKSPSPSTSAACTHKARRFSATRWEVQVAPSPAAAVFSHHVIARS